MNIRGKQINPWKYVVLTWTFVHALKAARTFIKAKRLAKKHTKRELLFKFADL